MGLLLIQVLLFRVSLLHLLTTSPDISREVLVYNFMIIGRIFFIGTMECIMLSKTAFINVILVIR